ncbi:S-layer homology domain-containing protein [Dethiosulfatibacter aminovorans DSM 17477]|uniref:S-layer homology domain-containing protein n=1 Tax=Dethiosulfatibacter aminovorans DSM 17477 TaxID=1121476 RepID=A0A1M6LP70_9FIRM|nr:S-layer homology domain-containing protein [Dethiosulfatibacter aminovorans]SHJ72953.1 S-layer homology domain-containing protein [Dethiosulfatibacter aminovorans DSM 17477]
MNFKYYLKIVFLSLLLGLFFGQAVFAFTDLDENDPNTVLIREFYDRGLTKGYPDGTFRPEGTITRAEFLTFVNRTFGFEGGVESLEFSDITGDEWFEGELRTAVMNGYIQGYPDGTFRPEKEISRQEVAYVLNSILEYPAEVFAETEDEIAIWAEDAVNALLQRKIMVLEEGFFHGEKADTRESVAVALLKTLHLKEEEAELHEKDDLPGGGTSSGGFPSGGDDVDRPDEDVIYSMEKTIAGLEKVIVGENSYTSKLDETSRYIVSDIKDAMESYLDDYEFDYESEMEDVKGRYRELSEQTQKDIELAIRTCVAADYLYTLQDFFIAKEF